MNKLNINKTMKDEMNGDGMPKMMPISDNSLTVGELINVLRKTDSYYTMVLLDLTDIGKGIVVMSGWMRMDCGDDKNCLALYWQGGGKAYTVEDLMRAIYWGEMERWFTNDTRVIIFNGNEDPKSPSTCAHIATGVTDKGASGMVITCERTQDSRNEGDEI